MGSALLKRRWSVAIVFTILSTVAVVATVSSWWTHRVLFDTDTWMETVGPIGTSEVVTDALSARFSDELIDWIDAEHRLGSLLPPILGPLADYGAGFINSVVIEETGRFFQSEFYANAWFRVNRAAHAAAVAVIRDEVTSVSTEGGVVTVDLIPVLTPIVDRVFARVTELGEAIPQVLLNQIDIDETIGAIIETYEREGLPESLGAIEVYSSEQLAAVQSTTAVLDRLVWVLPFLTVLFAAAAIYFAPLRFRVGWVLLTASALGWLLAWLAVTLIVGSVVSSIETDAAATVAEEVFAGITSGLTSLLMTLAVLAGLAGIGVLIWGFRSGREDLADDPTS
ncbi:MAG: hypothetical protein WAL25_02290 [Acidimicrobiia bacterium]